MEEGGPSLSQSVRICVQVDLQHQQLVRNKGREASQSANNSSLTTSYFLFNVIQPLKGINKGVTDWDIQVKNYYDAKIRAKTKARIRATIDGKSAPLV